MRILITGGEGFIGSHLGPHLAGHGHAVTRIDRRHGDLTQPVVANDLLASIQPELVVHLAAQVGRVFGEDNAAHTVSLNALATTLVAQACERRGVRLLYASTSEVYGDQGDQVCIEDGPMALPHNLYGLSKRWGEETARLYAQACGLQVVRLSMPYGPGLPHGRGRAAIVNMLWQADTRQRIPVHRGAERSWCWVGDCVNGIRLVIEQGEVGTGGSGDVGVYNVGNDEAAVPMLLVAKLACQIAGASADLIDEVDAPANQTVVKRLGMQRLRALGWQPTVPLSAGMHRTYAVARHGWLDKVAS